MRPLAVTLPVFALVAGVLGTGCDSASVSVAIPVMEASTVDGGSYFFTDSGTDAGSDARDGATRSEAATDSGHDATVPVDAHADAAPPIDAHPEATIPVDAHADTASQADARAEATVPVDAHQESTSPVDARHDVPGDTGAADTRAAGGGAPQCMDTGTPNEGWYTASTDTLICLVTCAGLTAKCEYKGTPQQGWYTTSGHGCPPHTTEILNDSTCQ